MSKNKKSRSSAVQANSIAVAKSGMNMLEKFTNVFVISMFTVFPVFMTDKLFNVRKDRLHYFIITTLALLFFILATYICGIDKDKWPKKLAKFSSADIGMLAFLVICTLSTVFSKYGVEALTGEKDRDSGLILMAVYVLCFFLISRYFKCTDLVFNIFIITASLVSVIAILHEFYVDPFNILTLIKAEQQSTFITTIGNKNLFSAFVCVALPVAVVMLVNAKDAAHTLFYSIACGIGFMGLLVADSDSGYFGLGAFMIILVIYACTNASRMFRYMLAAFSMLLSCKVLRLISFIFEDKMKDLDKIPTALIFDNKIYILIAVAAIVTAAFYLLSKKLGDKQSPKFIKIIAIILVIVCFLSVLLPFIYFSFIDTSTDLGSMSKYLRLDDKWGTHRGYAWIRSVILFKNNGIKNALIGCGPDTFGQIMKENYRQDMLDRHGSVFDSAHNEYLNYLVTVGILGLAAYISVIASILIRGVKRCKNSEHLLIIIFVIISYCAQATFNLAQPITTPFFFLFLGMGESVIRRIDLTDVDKKKE